MNELNEAKVIQEIETMRAEYMERMAERDLQSSIRLQNMFIFTKFRIVDGVK